MKHYMHVLRMLAYSKCENLLDFSRSRKEKDGKMRKTVIIEFHVANKEPTL